MHELEVVKIRLVKGTSLYSDKELNSPEAVMELIAGEMTAATTMWGSWNMWKMGWCTPLKGTQVTAVRSVLIPLETAVSAVSEVWGSYKMRSV